jgi:hypothetical protein
MYKCEICGKQSKPGEHQVKVIMETRDKVYTQIFLDPKGMPYEASIPPNPERDIRRGPMAFKEIVKEVNAHPACAEQTKNFTPSEFSVALAS